MCSRNLQRIPKRPTKLQYLDLNLLKTWSWQHWGKLRLSETWNYRGRKNRYEERMIWTGNERVEEDGGQGTCVLRIGDNIFGRDNNGGCTRLRWLSNCSFKSRIAIASDFMTNRLRNPLAWNLGVARIGCRRVYLLTTINQMPERVPASFLTDISCLMLQFVFVIRWTYFTKETRQYNTNGEQLIGSNGNRDIPKLERIWSRRTVRRGCPCSEPHGIELVKTSEDEALCFQPP